MIYPDFGVAHPEIDTRLKPQAVQKPYQLQQSSG